MKQKIWKRNSVMKIMETTYSSTNHNRFEIKVACNIAIAGR
jgi:hypothetical protein